jgi:release factor glutamine methyltransferase
LTREQADAFFALAKRRRDGEPVAYLVGRREFWGLPLAVDPTVLVPRPETETLVEAMLARLPPERPSRVLDLGTGSGAIALAIASERRHAQVVASDVSREALEVAQRNAAALSIANVAFVHSDWYASVPPQRFDAIVSNPPYVRTGDPHLRDGDVRFEPRLALDGGTDGLAALKPIVLGAAPRLAAGGWLAVEHGYEQAEVVRAVFEAAGFVSVQSLRDLAGIPRVVIGRSG